MEASHLPALDNAFKVTTNSVFFNPIPPPDSDEEFGDFCGPTNPARNEESSTAVRCQPNYDIDLEEDLTAVTQLSWTVPEEEEEEFTNFTSAEPDSPPVQDLFSSLVLEPQPELNETCKTEDDFGDFTQATSPVDLLSLDSVPIITQEETTSCFVESTQINWDEPLEPLEILDLPIVQTIVAEEEEFVFSEPAQEEEEEEFGDFTDFQTAKEEEEFDDFEAAAAPPVETPENQIQRVLMALFPLDPHPAEQQQIPLASKPGGSLWSYVSQLDSTPALSFSWRHSAAQQRFLHSLRIDSVLQVDFHFNLFPSFYLNF